MSLTGTAVVTLSSSVRGGPLPRVIKRNTMLLAATRGGSLGNMLVSALPMAIMA